MTQQPANRKRLSQRGVVAIVSLVFIFVLFALTGMAIDIGYVQTRRSMEQTAADAAATAAAMEIAAGRPTNAVAAADAAAKLNGFTDGTSNVAVNVSTTTSSASVTITQNMGLYFLPVFGVSSMNIAASASAGSSGSGSGSGSGQGTGCIYALSTSANPGLELDANLNANCDVVVNSTAQSNSVKWDSNAACAVTTNFMFNGVMNLYPGTSTSAQTNWTYNQNNQWYQQGGCAQRTTTSVCNSGGTGCKTFYQVPSTVAAAPVATMMTSTVSDPLSTLSQTSVEALQTCNALTSSQNGVSIDYNSAPNQTNLGVTYSGSGSSMVITLHPGVYCGGLTLGSQSTFTLNPGVYSIRGGTLTINSQAKVTGTGVMFYLSTPLSGLTNYSSVARLNFSGQPHVVLSGGDGTNGTTQDVVIMSNRNSTNTNALSFNGDSSSELKGSIYAPSDYFYITGTSSSGGNVNMDGIYYASGSCYGSTYLVASKIKVDGHAYFTVNKEANQCSSGGGTPRLTL
ncbi:MAG TPA: pilus assembly protein TadG-related protein [Bryobacteraceae bacterium]|jgi:hypothetical protein